MGDVIEVLTTATNTVEVAATGPQGAPGVGVPTGGSALQVLRKVSSTNYDTEWAAAGSGSGSVTSVALAGTGLSISGSPVTTSGTITANVSYGTTAGTACEGNDARIATIASGSVSTADGGGSINTRGTGSIGLGVSGTRTTLTGTATADRAISLPNASGTLATTSQAADYEVTDSTKGIILKSPNNTRWRVTINDDGTLSRAALALMTLLSFATSGFSQVRDMVTDTNGNIVTGRTNALTFTNSVTLDAGQGVMQFRITPAGVAIFSADAGEDILTIPFDDTPIFSSSYYWNAPSIRQSFGFSANLNPFWTANNASNARSAVGLGATWLTNTSVANFRTDIGLGSLATNNSVPSGAATTNSILTADGAGGSAFVATLPSLTIGVGTNTDITLQRETNNALSQRNGTNPQTLFLFNTYSNSTNYERGFLKWNTNVFQIGTEKGSAGGTARALELQADATTRLTISSAGVIGLGSSSSSSGLGASGLFVNTGAFQISMGSYLSSVQAYNQRVEIYGDNAAGTATVLMLSCGKDLVRFGGTTTNFPSLKRTNTVLQVRLADDSAFTTIDAQLRAQGTAPTNSTATGTAGDIRYDTNNFLYICVSSNTWRRTSLTNW